MMRIATAPESGVFCWPELVTGNPARAMEFYTSLFEWRPIEVTGERPYTLFQLDSFNAGALSGVAPGDPVQDARWNAAVSVENVDTAVARTRELGGRVLVGAADVGDVGRRAVVEDPCGASIALWQTQAHVNPRVPDAPGSLCWSELSTGDIGAAEAFYVGLFGWGSRREPGNTYIELLRNGEPIAGVLSRRPMWRGVRAQWVPYFSTADVDDAIDVARRHGGGLLTPPSTVPMWGRFALLRDPQGAQFGIYGVSEAA